MVSVRAPDVAALSRTIVAVICVGLTRVDGETEIPVPVSVMVAPAERLVPFIVSVTVVPACAEPGLMELTVAGEVRVKTTGDVELEPFETVTLRAPVVAELATAKLAVIWVALTTLTPLTVTPLPETATVAPLAKLVPVRVTLAAVLPTGVLAGVIPVSVIAVEVTLKVIGALVAAPWVTVRVRAPGAAEAASASDAPPNDTTEVRPSRVDRRLS